VTGVLYAGLLELKQSLSIADEANDVDLERALEAASRYIDDYCGRQFSLTAPDTRLYYPDDAFVVRTPDLVTPTTVKVDADGDQTFSVTIPAADYELWPLNVERYQQVRVRWSADRAFTPGRYVQVVGTFGCVVGNAPPVAVKQATLIQAARYYKRSTEAPFGVLQNTDLGQYTRLSQSDPDVVALLAPWRLTSEGAAWVMV
jgi:hypothetical protein